MTAAEATALRVEELLKPAPGERKMFHAAAQWKIPAQVPSTSPT